MAVALASVAGVAHATKPRSALMWESIEPSAATSEVNSHTIYLHRCAGSDCTVMQGNTNSTTNPVRSSLGHGVLGAFSQSDETWNQVVACMKDVYSPFNVEITTESPGSAPHFEILFGGKPQEIGLSAGIGGVSPFSCVPYIPNSVVFVFDVWGNDAEEICATAAQEIAHSFSLDHSTEASDPMTYYPYKGRRHYVNQQIQCGSDCDKDHRSPLGATCSGDTYQNHVCACGNGSQTQNDYQTISALFGGGSGDPPSLKILSPKTGDFVGDGFAVSFEASAETSIASSELRVDGTLVRTIKSGTSFVGPSGLADGTHQVEVTAYTATGASSRSRVDVVVGPGCKDDTGCGTGQACIGGRCVAGPEITGGLGTSCAAATDCASLQCANSDGAKYCVEACKPGQCPSGFGCRDDGAGGGVCWPGYDDSSGGCAISTAGTSDLPIGGALFGLGMLGAVIRRRRTA
ncbi:MAG TPA: Ig-like domain-containing protein [Kofleriaceae bacterium]|nr:Ig-like domain-containing protein [Kofleriaceae bacterium]